MDWISLDGIIEIWLYISQPLSQLRLKVWKEDWSWQMQFQLTRQVGTAVLCIDHKSEVGILPFFSSWLHATCNLSQPWPRLAVVNYRVVPLKSRLSLTLKNHMPPSNLPSATMSWWSLRCLLAVFWFLWHLAASVTCYHNRTQYTALLDTPSPSLVHRYCTTKCKNMSEESMLCNSRSEDWLPGIVT